MAEIYIGLISGTSIDCIDAVITDLSENTPKLLATHSEPIKSSLKARIIELCTPGNNEIDKTGQLDIELGALFAKAAEELLAKSKHIATDVQAIGSHGQTVRHRPSTDNATNGFTLQIGDPNTIAEITGITTVADFRRRDMAAGGQGAPFAPVFHQAIAPKNIETTAFLNLGGIANITLIHNGELICGFDTGPANGLMDAWIQKNQHKDFDANGDWAKSGVANPDLLQKLGAHPYFTLSIPKSTGREDFNLAWIEQALKEFAEKITPEDVQATLLELSCQTIVDSIQSLPNNPSTIFCCGGGAHNKHLIATLTDRVGDRAIQTTETLGIGPDWIEACAFAWFAQQTVKKSTARLRRVTGANADRILGGLYFS